MALHYTRHPRDIKLQRPISYLCGPVLYRIVAVTRFFEKGLGFVCSRTEQRTGRNLKTNKDTISVCRVRYITAAAPVDNLALLVSYCSQSAFSVGSARIINVIETIAKIKYWPMTPG